jgi:DNA-binding beta-propeller fold protein YncE
VGCFPAQVAVNGRTNKIYVAFQIPGNIVEVDGATDKTTTTLPGTGSYLGRIAVNPLANEVYAANLISGDTTIYAGEPKKLPVTLLEFVGK